MLAASALVLAIFAATANAHGAVTTYEIDGTTYQGYKGFSPDGKPTIQWQWPNYDPMLTPLDARIMCNGGTNAQLSATAAPGATVTAIWAQWTHQQAPCSAYLYKCDGDTFSGCDGKKNQWFKIAELGLISGGLRDGVWCGSKIMETGRWTHKIPTGLKPGNYLIRHELIAFHQANTPQFYPECAQITVTGSGTAYPTSEYFTSFPGYAQPNDSNIKIPIDTTAKDDTTYIVPGPKVWTGGSGPTSPVVTSKSPSPSPKVTSPSPSPKVSPSPSPSPKTSPSPVVCTNPVLKNNQCGGQTYTGSTCCATGSTCKYVNAYYSQCQ